MMQIRPYRSSDAPAIAGLFYESVRTLGLRRYSPRFYSLQST